MQINYWTNECNQPRTYIFTKSLCIYCVDVHGENLLFEIVSGIRNPKLVQELEQQLIEAYDLMDTTG